MLHLIRLLLMLFLIIFKIYFYIKFGILLFFTDFFETLFSLIFLLLHLYIKYLKQSILLYNLIMNCCLFTFRLIIIFNILTNVFQNDKINISPNLLLLIYSTICLIVGVTILLITIFFDRRSKANYMFYIDEKQFTIDNKKEEQEIIASNNLILIILNDLLTTTIIFVLMLIFYYYNNDYLLDILNISLNLLVCFIFLLLSFKNVQEAIIYTNIINKDVKKIEEIHQLKIENKKLNKEKKFLKKIIRRSKIINIIRLKNKE
jgi:hypothetical protein